MNKKVKVLFYNGSLRMGGIERVLTEVLQNINRKNMENMKLMNKEKYMQIKEIILYLFGLSFFTVLR